MPDETTTQEEENQETQETESKQTKGKQLTEQQIETRRRHALTVIRTHKTLLDDTFWRDYVSAEEFEAVHDKLVELAPSIKTLKAEAQLEKLREMGVVIPKNFKLQFDE